MENMEYPNPPYPTQKLKKPGIEEKMELSPQWKGSHYKESNKLFGKKALVTGGDSGIGRAVAYFYAREGADVAITYLPEEEKDALEIARAIEAIGKRCLLFAGDLREKDFCKRVVQNVVKEFGELDILVSNAAWQNRKKTILDITDEEWEKTFESNIYSYFYLVREAVKFMKPGSSIIATSSQVATEGSKELLDYSATKGAIISFSKSLAQSLIEKGIRVNTVAPGPVWTPLNPADEGLPPENVSKFGESQPIGRAAQPEEIAPAYVFLASNADSSYISGITIQEMGGL